MPRREGDFKIPSVVLQYFNVATKSYKTISTEEILITVTKGTSSGSVVSNYTTPNKEDVKFGNDIQFIKTGDLAISKPNDFFFKSIAYWILNILIALATIFLIFFKRKQIELNNDVSRMKNKRANKE